MQYITTVVDVEISNIVKISIGETISLYTIPKVEITITSERHQEEKPRVGASPGMAPGSVDIPSRNPSFVRVPVPEGSFLLNRIPNIIGAGRYITGGIVSNNYQRTYTGNSSKGTGGPNQGGYGYGGGIIAPNNSLSPEYKIATYKPLPVDNGQQVKNSNSKNNGVVGMKSLQNVKDIGDVADKASGVIGFTQIGLFEYGVINNSSAVFRYLGTSSKYLGLIGYAGSVAGFILDINSVRNGEISTARFGYRTGTVVTSIIAGAAIGGPWGAVGGVAVGGVGASGEYLYDNVLAPLGKEAKYQMNYFERMLRRGQLPGK